MINCIRCYIYKATDLLSSAVKINKAIYYTNNINDKLKVKDFYHYHLQF